MEPGSIVKAVYDFATEEDGELPLLVGDVVQVLRKVDKQWLYGVSNGRGGNFPSNFVIELKTPVLQNDQELFAALSNFTAQELGDLSFKKGDLIIGIREVDTNWWNGECNSQNGIFPLTHVWKMDQKNLTTPAVPKKLNLRGKVKMNMKAQLRAEMDLHKDEIVLITEEVDKGWYRGECNGRSGIFPASFVAILSDQNETDAGGGSSSNDNFLTVENKELTSGFESDVTPNSSSQYGYDCVNSGITSYGRAIYPFKGEFKNELTFKEGEIVNLIRHVDDKWMEGEIDGRAGLFPKDFIEIIVDCPGAAASAERVVSNSGVLMQRPEVYEFSVDTYGRVLHDFLPQVEGDIQLKEGDTVTLIRRIDQNWLEVITDTGDIGICPSTFIEVIGSGPETLPPSYSEVMKLVNYCNNELINGAHTAKNCRPVSYPPATHSQFATEVTTTDYNSSVVPAVSRSIDSKIAENLLEIYATPASSDIYSTAHSEKKPEHLSSYISEFSSNRNNKSRVPAFPVVGSFQIDDTWEDGRCDSLKKSDTTSSYSFKSSFQPETTSSPNVKSNTLDKGESKASKMGAPQRPPVPTITWPSGSQGGCTPPSQPMSSVASPPKPLRRQSSETSPFASSNGAQKNVILQQISEKEERVQKFEACRNKIKLQIENGANQKDFVSSELNTQAEQFGDEIDRLKREIEILRNDLPKPLSRTHSVESRSSDIETGSQLSRLEIRNEQEDQRKLRERANKMKEQRSCVITEILQTERDYISDLKILHSTFLTNPEEGRAKGVDISTLFGNLDEVIDLANRLLRRLQKTASAGPERQMIGECFVDMAEDMKQVYGHYCRNHDDINAVLEKYGEKSPGGQYLRFKLEQMKRQTNCFDLPSMLIKPVQRILKYPLLLNELVKCTEDGHPDKQSLIEAIGLMTDVATAINEFKRRKDLVFKYRKHADTSLSGRISKLNFHSMLKKSSRLGMRLSSTIGLRSVTKDEAFEKVVRNFSTLEKSIKIFLKDVTTYSEEIEEFVTTGMNMAEDIAELYQERKCQEEVDQFRSAHRIIVTQFWEAFKRSIERSVITTLRCLLRTYEGPNNLIQKRSDKLLDFEACANKLEKNKDATKLKMLQDNELWAKQMYEALNSQLLDDLPRLCSTSTDIFRECILAFLRARKSFVSKTARYMLSLMELPLLLGSQGGGILETFQVKHTLVMDNMCQLTIIPKHLFPSAKSDTLKKNPSPHNTRLSFGATAQAPGLQVPQSSSERAHILSSYDHAQIYSACQDYNATDLLDISLKKGDFVGVIKQQDPMGSRFRWFVDKGSVKGFVPAKVLIKFLMDSSQKFPSQASLSCSVPLAPLNENGITSARSISQCSRDFRRNDNFRHSFGENMAVNKPANSPSLSVATRSLERDKSCKPLQPSRPAPAPRLAKVTDNSNSLNFQTTGNLSQVAERNGLASMSVLTSDMASCGNISINVPLNNVLQPTSPPLYEEIDDRLYDQGRYELILDVPSENKCQTEKSYTNVPLDEFDPYAEKRHTGIFYDNVPDHSTAADHRYEDIVDDVTSVEDEPQQNSSYYYSMYDFAPVGLNQLKLFKGQVILVLHKCDLNGNSDWWFVEDRYQNKGYVPGSYLSKYN